MRLCPSRPITTSRRRRASTGISPRSRDAVDLPIVLYNIPGRSMIEISVGDHGDALRRLPTSSASRMRPAILRAASRDRGAVPARVSSGSPATMRRALGFMAHGGRGCISVTSNVAPHALRRFPERVSDG